MHAAAPAAARQTQSYLCMLEVEGILRISHGVWGTAARVTCTTGQCSEMHRGVWFALQEAKDQIFGVCEMVHSLPTEHFSGSAALGTRCEAAGTDLRISSAWQCQITF